MKKILIFVSIIFINFSVLADEKWQIERADEGDPIYQNNVGYYYLYGLNGFRRFRQSYNI